MIINNPKKTPNQQRIKPTEVLYVEDDPDDLYLVQSYLSEAEELSVALSHAPTITKAKPKLKTESVDLILLDLSTGSKAGLDTLQEMIDFLRQIDQHPPIIILTGDTNIATGENAISMGAADYLPKREANRFTISRIIRFALERQRLVDELRFRAQHDELTGLLNRSESMRRCRSLLEHCRRTPMDLYFGILDLDDFKPINDQYGHLIGDELLRVVGSRLKQHSRQTDMAGRLGGDEFLMVWNHVPTEKKIQVMSNKLKTALEKPVTLMHNGQTLELAVGFSMGLVKYSPPDSLKKVLTLADAAMYQCKKEGGGCNVVGKSEH